MREEEEIGVALEVLARVRQVPGRSLQAPRSAGNPMPLDTQIPHRAPPENCHFCSWL